MKTHGLASTYVHGPCRCPECKKAKAYYAYRDRVARFRRLKNNPELADTLVHGTSTYANWGCRCEICVSATKEYSKSKKLKKLPD